jgi:hypothetical protein
MSKFNSYKGILWIFICACCVSPFTTSLSGSKVLVVDGLITDQMGPQIITLSYSSSLGVGAFTRELIPGAIVTLLDNGGTQIQLTEESTGIYQTDSTFTAQPGKSYFIRISLNNEMYESDQETLLPVGQLDSLFYKLQATSIVPQFEIYANSSKPLQSSGLMRWRSSYTYQIMTQPYLVPLPDTPPCSGVLTIPKTSCICCICWVSGKNNGVAISNGSNFIDDKFNNNLVAIIPIGDEQFEFKYYLKVEQLSLSTNAYNFWNLVISQQTGASSLFQPVSAQIQGNIHSITNPNEQVLGLFQVSSVTSRSIFINRNDIPFNLQPAIPLNISDCRVEGTNIQPAFW